MKENERRPSRKKGKVARRRNPKDQERRARRRNPRPEQALGQVVLEAGLVAQSESLTRSLIDLVAGYLRDEQVGIRFNRETGEPWVLAKHVERARDRISRLRDIIACLLSPGSMDAAWLGSCPPSAIRRNPAFVGVHVTGDDLEEDDLDYDEEYDDDEEEDDR